MTGGEADGVPGAGGVLEVVRAGALTTVQDLGRVGHAHLGVPRSGALDAPAHRLANRLVGNPEDAATLETTLTGCAVRAERPVVVAVTGAPCAVRIDGRPAPWGAAVRVPSASAWAICRTATVAGPEPRGAATFSNRCSRQAATRGSSCAAASCATASRHSVQVSSAAGCTTNCARSTGPAAQSG